jgi:Tol biopolymer transport system component/predicted Ser/Thr protein kinase
MVGQVLGRYRIEERIGSGGMGVVYRAYDPELRRSVAIKFVTTTGAAGAPDARERLLAEARAASALNHPNVCTVFEVGETGGNAFIAMEFIEGQPLSQMVPHGGLPVETAIRYGMQIADALAHAHEHGVVHRDLKSSNVVVTRDGRAKVLDFGLARRIEAELGDPHTRTKPTDRAVMGGTLAYMPPEVLLGETADARSDIWSLGVVLYEMASGELPFKGRNEFDLTAEILRSPAQLMPRHVPPILRAVVLRCLAKEPAQRYQRASETRAALEAIQSGVSAIQELPAAAMPRGRKLVWTAIAAAALAVAAGGAIWLWPRTDPVDMWQRTAQQGRLAQVASSDTRAFEPAISPDGRMVVYVTQDAQRRTDLLVAGTAGGTHLRLTDDEALESVPRFSPDGDRIAYTRRQSLAGSPEICIVPSLGGEPACVVTGAYAVWSPDGTRLAFLRRPAPDAPAELVTARLDGSDVKVLLRADSVYPFIRSPAWSPDARLVAIVRGTGGAAGEIWLIDADGGEPRRATDDTAPTFCEYPSFTPDGHGILHSSNRSGATNLWIVSLGDKRLVQLTSGAGPDEGPTIAGDGNIAFVNSRWRNTLVLHGLGDGATRMLYSHAPYIWAPTVSPDGREVAFSRGEVDGSWHIWTMPVAGGTPRRLTATAAGEVYPRYTPDGASVLYHTWSGPRSIWLVPAAGGVARPLRASSDQGEGFADVSPDGRWVAFARTEALAERVYVISIDGRGERLLTESPATVPRWSPDGRRIAFSPSRGFSGGIFVVNADGTGERRLTTSGGWPVWWPDGKRIGFLALGADATQQVRIISVDGGESRPLETLQFLGDNHPFDVTRDGRWLVTSNSLHVTDEIWVIRPPS